tara:strand:- start:440 stop:634 length:195 start_codon:yes stop_codon:yes gene_type:complete
MANLVSPCCGDDYTELDFRTEEHMYTCSGCKQTFEIPETDYEFSEAAKEAREEDRMDERRDMGE